MLGANRTFLSLLLIVCIIKVSYSAVVGWGADCQNDDCVDHRLVCEQATELNTTEKKCVCDRYHKWNATLQYCILKYTTKEFLDQLTEKYDLASKIEEDANLMFYAQLTAGLLVIAVGAVCCLLVIGYCIRMQTMDTELDDLVKNLEAQNQANKPSTSRRLR